jgi:hemolysin III
MMSSAKKSLPSYTLGEELVSAISHGTGALFGVLALILCVIKSVLHESVIGIVASAIYGASMIVLYSMSTLYHALGRNRHPRRLLRIRGWRLRCYRCSFLCGDLRAERYFLLILLI